MMRLPYICVAIVGAAFFTCLGSFAADKTEAPASVKFVKHVVDPEFPAISVTTVDVDYDGRLDLVAAGGPSGGPSEWSNLAYWYQAPDWKKAPVCALASNAVLLHVESCNFSGSKVSGGEVVLTEGMIGQLWWYRYDLQAKKWTGELVATNDIQYAHGSANGDVDGDGYNDILVPTGNGTRQQGIAWLKNPGKAGREWIKYPLAKTFQISGWQHYVRLVDMNGDGRLDALHGSDGDPGWFGFWLHPDKPTDEWLFHPLEGPMKHGTNLEAADLNGDKKMDLIATEGHAAGIWAFMAPDFKPTRVDETLKSAHALTLADYDGDGSVDIAACGYDSKRVVCFLNDGKGGFRPIDIDTNQCAYDAAAIDLDGDGDKDIILAGQNSMNLVWYENVAK